MNKNYILAFAALSLMAFAASTGADAARKVNPGRFATQPSAPVTIEKISDATPNLDDRFKAPEMGWEVIGEGLYHDELFMSWGMPPENWKVVVEQNSSKKGWYRFIPYNENSSVADVLGYPDDQYMYINATNPNKVYAEEFTVYGTFLFSNVVLENDWDESYQYGTLVDGIITWPPVNTWATYDSHWKYCIFETGPALYLPGSDFKDFSMDMVTEYFCTDDNKHDILLTAGDDIVAFKHTTVKGFDYVSERADDVAANGTRTDVEGGGAFITLDLNDLEPGIYTTMVVGVDDKGNPRASRQTNFIVPVHDSAEDWLELGTTTFTEPLYYGCYDDFRPELLTARVSKSLTTDGLFMLENAYESHSELASALTPSHASHKHGICVLAADPEKVYVLPSSLGVAVDGDGAAWSIAGQYLESGFSEEEVANEQLFGTMTKNANNTYTVKIPYGTLMLGEKNYAYGEFIPCDSEFSFILPESAAVESNYAEEDNAEYYNLQGIRVAPHTKGLVITRKAGHVSKNLYK